MTVGQLVGMSPERRGIAAEAAILLPAVRLGLALLPYATLERTLVGYARRFRSTPRDRSTVPAWVAWAVAALGRRVPGGASCLVQALTACALLRRRGVVAELRIGVRQPGSAIPLAAHAWVESDGRIVVGPLDDLPTYHPLVAPGERLTCGLGALLRGAVVPWRQLAIEPDVLLAACADGDLTGLVHQALQNGAVGSDWPEAVRAELAIRARGAAGIELVRGHEIRRVLDALALTGIRPLLFKGTALAYGEYPHPALRPRGDTDLLIRQREAGAVRRVLAELGYHRPVYCEGELLFRQFELQRRDGYGIEHAFDFHWRISTQALFSEMFDYDELAAGARPVPGLGSNARTPAAPEALLLSCLHPVMHHRNEQRLIWVYDTHLLASRLTPAEWDRFLDLAAGKALAAICRHGLDAARRHLGTAVPEDVHRRLGVAAARREPSAAYLEPGRGWRHELGASLGALPRWRDRGRLLWEVAFPPSDYMLRAYGLDATPRARLWLPLLYLHRGVRGGWQVLRGRK